MVKQSQAKLEKKQHEKTLTVSDIVSMCFVNNQNNKSLLKQEYRNNFEVPIVKRHGKKLPSELLTLHLELVLEFVDGYEGNSDVVQKTLSKVHEWIRKEKSNFKGKVLSSAAIYWQNQLGTAKQLSNALTDASLKEATSNILGNLLKGAKPTPFEKNWTCALLKRWLSNPEEFVRKRKQPTQVEASNKKQKNQEVDSGEDSELEDDLEKDDLEKETNDSESDPNN